MHYEDQHPTEEEEIERSLPVDCTDEMQRYFGIYTDHEDEISA